MKLCHSNEQEVGSPTGSLGMPQESGRLTPIKIQGPDTLEKYLRMRQNFPST